MVTSAAALVFLMFYLYKRQHIHLALIVASILPQYHFRYWLFEVTGFANYVLIYGDTHDVHMGEVNDYLNMLLMSFCAVFFVYVQLVGRKTQSVDSVERLKRSKSYAGLLIGLLLYSIYFRMFDNVPEESFSTFVLALLMATFAYAGSYAKTPRERLFVILTGGMISVLIGFKSVILILFISILLGTQNLQYGKFSLYLIFIVVLMLLASILRGVEANIVTALFALATSHYDSWSFLVIAFGERSVDHVENFTNWLASFATLIPGASSYFEIQSYGHFLNFKYTADWFNNTSVLLAPGIIGELWSLGSWLPFLFLPLIVIGYDLLFKAFARSGLPMRTIMLSLSIFLLESPLSNLGQFVKVIITAAVLGKLLGHVKIVRRPSTASGEQSIRRPAMAPSIS